jgi:NAD-dependent deacetylase
MQSRRIFVLTGSGVSAESGLGTFRDLDGLWTQYDLEDVASIDGYRRNPRLVLDFYDERRENLKNAQPNAAHIALAQLEQALDAAGGDLFLCTQNVDDLHERAGSRRVWHMHGELNKARCDGCAAVFAAPDHVGVDSSCPSCGLVGLVRPHMVWFGEMPFYMDEIDTALSAADLFVAIGTSGAVYPAAGLVSAARAIGVQTMELNLAPSDNAFLFHQKRYGLASEVTPAWVTTLIASI